MGMTRAKKKLSLTSAYRRRTYDSWVANDPSIFLSEIPDEFLITNIDKDDESSGLEKVKLSKDDGYYYDYDESTDIDMNQLKAGSNVSHHTYGQGKVVSLASDFGEVKAIVDFKEHGKRKVMLRHLQVAL